MRVLASSRRSARLPNWRAPDGQTSVQAGARPFFWRSAQKVHFLTSGVALVNSYLGTPKGHTIMQYRQPRQRSVWYTTGPSGVFSSALTTQPEAQAGVTQCMHCVTPACASGCVVKALEKTPEGPVVYHTDRCLGCRYCMIVCPFGVPKYEFTSATPLVKKCTFCAERQKKGLAPACTEVCPSGALKFGRRADLLEEAKTRIYTNPDAYVHKIYGEDEAGGTSWLYISDVPFESLALPAGIEKKSYPEMADGALSAVPFVITLWPPLLMGMYTFSKRRDEVAAK